MPSFTSSLYSKEVVAGNKLEKLPQERNCNWDNVGNLQKWQLMSPWDMITRNTHVCLTLNTLSASMTWQSISSTRHLFWFRFSLISLQEALNAWIFSCYSNLWKGKREGKASLDHQQSIITWKVSSLFSSEMGMRRWLKPKPVHLRGHKGAYYFYLNREVETTYFNLSEPQISLSFWPKTAGLLVSWALGKWTKPACKCPVSSKPTDFLVLAHPLATSRDNLFPI